MVKCISVIRRIPNGLKSNKRKVVFIDEFPWIATARSKFLMAFEHFWNTYCTKRNDLVVVICGSSASFMVNNIIKNKGGLHNRLSYKINREESVVQNIDRLCFENDGILANEFNEVFTSLFTNSDVHEHIIRALSKTKKGATRKKMLELCNLGSGGVFSKALEEFIESN